MPKEGFKSITVSDYIYDRFQEVYNGNKEALATKGVRSLSGYVSYMLEEAMNRDETFARYAPKIESISVEDDRVILKDNLKNRIVEIVLQKGELHCFLCDASDCIHVGYVYSMPDVYTALDAKGMGRRPD
ncbi:MAG: hypothetical protein OXP12_08465 [Thaumarchaeota archaeon]|nr:hypothetical protein [Nitrososphaerota archaeon]MDE0265956.1 hypothetical protein [Nitrososphaerota archaeon]MDE0525867.1 hypothetical protein [Nitrososphaerota archaeon]